MTARGRALESLARGALSGERAHVTVGVERR